MKKQALSLALLCAIILTSCGGGGSTSETTADTTPAVTTSSDPLDNLDFGGKTVSFLYRNEISNEFYVDKENGDIVNDAIYKSFNAVEERLNVNIDVTLRDGHLTSARGEFMDHIRGSVMAGDDSYDWVDSMIGLTPEMVGEGLFADITRSKYIDLEKPYYINNLVDTVGIDGKLYFLAGDASLGYMKTGFCIYFNQRLIDDYKLESPYKIVDEGRWTVDEVAKLSVQASQDVNGDGNYDMNDKLGFVVHDSNHTNGFLVATEQVLYEKSTDGVWSFTYGTERDVDVTNRIFTLLKATAGSYNPNVTNAVAEQVEKYNQVTSKFITGDILFMTAEIDDSVVGLRAMNDTYGILPFPKGDENQAEYRSSSRNTHNAFAMPIICKDYDMAGAVMEALSASNYETVMPAYFETALKTKYSRDNDSARMYDLIRDTMRLDTGYIYTNAAPSAAVTALGVFRTSINAENKLTTLIAANVTALDEAIKNYIEKVRENNEK